MDPQEELKLHVANLRRLAAGLENCHPAFTDPRTAEEILKEAAERVPLLIRKIRVKLAGEWQVDRERD